MKFESAGQDTLLPFLIKTLKGKSRTTVKSYLTNGLVSVNNITYTRHDTPVKPGDIVEIASARRPEVLRHKLLRIVFEDEHIIVIDKRQGLLSIATDKEATRTAFHILSDYVKRQDPANRIFIVHRLDRETSGLMLFARSQQVQETMQRSWRHLVSDRRYAAVVEGALLDSEGEITTFLTEDRNRKVWASREGDSTATTFYKVLSTVPGYQLVDLKLETGRKNQIRAHMEYMKTPIAGDKKYSAATNPAGRVCLHAYKLNFIHPVTDMELDFSTPFPSSFNEIMSVE